jgi:hypothetical protein
MLAIAVDQIARKTACRTTPAIALNSDPAPVDRGLFAGVADFPSIDEVFAARSLSILASNGISAWYGAGGRRGYDGRLSFGAISSPALEIVQDLADTSCGFRWTDDAGATWAVRFAHDQDHDTDRSAFAVTYRGSAWVIDSRRWRPALQTLRAQVAGCSQPARSWDDADRSRYSSLTRALHSLRLVDGAERILGYLLQRADGKPLGHVLLSVEELESVLASTDAEPHSTPAVGDPAAMLRATMGFEIARLQLGSLGWNPHVIHQSAAVTEVELIGSESFRICVSPLFGEVAATFARAVNLRNARRAQQKIARLAKSVKILIR